MPAAPSAAGMDLIARAVEDALAGRPHPVGLERDDGLIVELPAAAFLDASAGPHEEALLAHARGEVLDAGCGAGRLALPLQAAGLHVVGLDLSPGLCDVCRRRGLREVREGDVWRDLGGPWDTILLGNNNLGIGGDVTGAGRLVAHLAAALRPGGAILATSLDVTMTTEPQHLAYHARNRRAGRDVGAVRLRVLYRAVRGPWFDWVHVAPAELAELAAGAGLTAALGPLQPSGNYGAVLRRP